MYRISLTGKVRSRTRVKILWFWIVGKWREDPFNEEMKVNIEDRLASFYWHGFDGTVGVVNGGSAIAASVKYKRVPLIAETFPISVAISKPFKSEPIKGVIVEGELKVERV